MIPVVIYPGPGKWSAVRHLRDLIEIPAEISDWAATFVPDCGFLLVELAGLPLEKLADGRLARAVMGALQGERVGGMKFQEIQRIVAEIFAEPQRGEALKIASLLCQSGPALVSEYRKARDIKASAKLAAGASKTAKKKKC